MGCNQGSVLIHQDRVHDINVITKPLDVFRWNQSLTENWPRCIVWSNAIRVLWRSRTVYFLFYETGVVAMYLLWLIPSTWILMADKGTTFTYKLRTVLLWPSGVLLEAHKVWTINVRWPGGEYQTDNRTQVRAITVRGAAARSPRYEAHGVVDKWWCEFVDVYVRLALVGTRRQKICDYPQFIPRKLVCDIIILVWLSAGCRKIKALMPGLKKSWQ